MKDLISKIEAEFESFQKDANSQLESGNKAAGTRARKASLELTKLFKEFRKVSVEEGKKQVNKKGRLIGVSLPYHDRYYSNSKRERLCVYS